MGRKHLVLLPLILALALLWAPSIGNAQSTDPTTVYIVQRGDTLAQIAWRFGVDVRSLQAANHLYNPGVIVPGQQLVIPNAGKIIDAS